MNNIVYDKFGWHVENVQAEQLAQYYSGLMDFLYSHQLLSSYGKEIHDFGVDSSFSITSEMLTEYGNTLLSTKYDDFLSGIDFEKETDFGILDEHIVSQ